MRKREIRSKRGAADMFSPFGDNVRGPLYHWNDEHNRLALEAFRTNDYAAARAATGLTKKQIKNRGAWLSRNASPKLNARKLAAALPF